MIIHVAIDFYYTVVCNYLLEIRCDNPANVRTVSCGSGSTTMGYEGDTCSFTCNTGYELTGSDTRTCQRDGSWSGNDDVCRRGSYMPYYMYVCLLLVSNYVTITVAEDPIL